MALAVREWQGLTTEDTMTAIVINQGGEEFVKGVRWAEAKLKKKTQEAQMTDSTLPPLPKAVAWQKAIRRSDEDGDCIIGWDYCWNEYEFNALLIPKRALFTAEQITTARSPRTTCSQRSTS